MTARQWQLDVIQRARAALVSSMRCAISAARSL
jgi:hypothetical protein